MCVGGVWKIFFICVIIASTCDGYWRPTTRHPLSKVTFARKRVNSQRSKVDKSKEKIPESVPTTLVEAAQKTQMLDILFPEKLTTGTDGFEVNLALKNELDKQYRLTLSNDDVNVFDTVVRLITNVMCSNDHKQLLDDLHNQVIPMISKDRSYEITKETERSGSATLYIGNKKLIGEYLNKLKNGGLKVEMFPNDDFDDSLN